MLESLIALCGSAVGAASLPGLLLAGLVGSVLHCAPMCGPFVLGQTADRLARIPAARLCEASRLRGALLWPYHLGRITTYAALGAVAAGIGGQILSPRVSGGLLAIAALLFATHALRRLAPGLRTHIPGFDRAPAAWVAQIGRVTAPLDRTGWPGGLLLGLALGFLPCGFLYAALLAATATGSAAGGALAMIAFGLGTVPTLVAVGVAGRAAGLRWHRAAGAIAPAVMLFNAAVLGLLAWQAIAQGA